MTDHLSRLNKYKAMVLVGGLGTRLQSAFAEGPKAMAPIHGVPFLTYLLNELADAGFEDVVLCVGFRHQQIQDWFGNGASVNLGLQYSVEAEPLGTGGAIRLGAKRFASDRSFFAVNGDTLHPIDYSAMLRYHEERKAKCTMALAEVDDTSRYGLVDLDRDGTVTAFREKSSLSQRGYINSGIYVFEPDMVEAIPEGRPVSLEREILPQLLGKGLAGFPSPGYFIDIGVPDDYFRAQRELTKLECK